MEKVTVLQCMDCGSIAHGDRPENLRRVCLECCSRMKENEPEPGYLVFQIEAPIQPHPCKFRQYDCNEDHTDTCKHDYKYIHKEEQGR